MHKVTFSIGLAGMALFLLIPGKADSGDQAWTEPLTGLVFHKVDGGCYEMGQGDREKGELELFRGVFNAFVSFGDEFPVHEVCVGGFSMAASEVTLAAFRSFVESTGYLNEAEREEGCQEYPIPRYRWVENPDRNWREPGFRQKDDEPVVCVSWNDSKAFTQWLTKKNPGREFRLATEAEWEYAARERGIDQKYAGGDILDELGWNENNSPRRTSPVAGKKANSLGIHDLSGNVWEWVSDNYERNYYGKSGKENPQGPAEGFRKVVRGGGWNSKEWNCRAANRDQAGPSHRDTNLGFRVVFTGG